MAGPWVSDWKATPKAYRLVMVVLYVLASLAGDVLNLANHSGWFTAAALHRGWLSTAIFGGLIIWQSAGSWVSDWKATPKAYRLVMVVLFAPVVLAILVKAVVNLKQHDYPSAAAFPIPIILYGFWLSVYPFRLAWDASRRGGSFMGWFIPAIIVGFFSPISGFIAPGIAYLIWESAGPWVSDWKATPKAYRVVMVVLFTLASLAGEVLNLDSYDLPRAAVFSLVIIFCGFRFVVIPSRLAWAASRRGGSFKRWFIAALICGLIIPGIAYLIWRSRKKAAGTLESGRSALAPEAPVGTPSG